MNESNKDPTCKCDCCNTDIPLSAALTPEGQDYVYHFCGENCLLKWRKTRKTKEQDESNR